MEMLGAVFFTTNAFSYTQKPEQCPSTGSLGLLIWCWMKKGWRQVTGWRNASYFPLCWLATKKDIKPPWVISRISGGRKPRGNHLPTFTWKVAVKWSLVEFHILETDAMFHGAQTLKIYGNLQSISTEMRTYLHGLRHENHDLLPLVHHQWAVCQGADCLAKWNIGCCCRGCSVSPAGLDLCSSPSSSLTSDAYSCSHPRLLTPGIRYQMSLYHSQGCTSFGRNRLFLQIQTKYGSGHNSDRILDSYCILFSFETFVR